MNGHGFFKMISSVTARFTSIAVIVCVLSCTGVNQTSAGNLTPPGPSTTPTMRTLEQLKPTWDKIIPSQRFVDALDGTAVLDKETGLVWEKSPDSTNGYSWADAQIHCSNLYVGGRMGWRLPTIEELTSLVDRANPGLVKLPVGHPSLSYIQDSWYWSSSTDPGDPAYALVLYMHTGTVNGHNKTTYPIYAWCVRGGL